MNEEKRTSSRKTRVGKVVSDKMDKTVVVAIEDRVAHPLYKKIVGRTYKLKAHDEQNAAKHSYAATLYECVDLAEEQVDDRADEAHHREAQCVLCTSKLRELLKDRTGIDAQRVIHYTGEYELDQADCCEGNNAVTLSFR